MVEDLGFDALYVGDHPAWDRECWLQRGWCSRRMM
jgi:hypothetical protein